VKNILKNSNLQILQFLKLMSLCALILLGFNSYVLQANETAEQHEENDGTVELSPNSGDLYNIKVSKVKLHNIAKKITAPGEVVLNAYKTSIVALRIDGQIIKRLAKMGDQVIVGQPMAIISSIPMSEAQQSFIENVNEWQRVKKLGKSVVSGKRYLEAKTNWLSSKSKLSAYGIDKDQLTQLASKQVPDGLFELKSTIEGLVINDDFIEGQYVDAGTELFVVSDESSIWVEASVSPEQAALFSMGDIAEISHANEVHSGKVIQVSHFVSESTRTQKIRIEIDNSKDDLHPGQFVSTRIRQSEVIQKVALPVTALTRTADGDWGVFVEIKPLHYIQQEVEVLGQQGDLMIVDGIKLGTPVVVEGAFYLSAELAKAGFDPHGH